MRNRIALFAALVATAAPAVAQERCWLPDEVAAARVRDLQSALMVGALQCRGSSHEVLADYNRFVVAARSAIGGHNDRLKAHFEHAFGAREGQRAYDRFTTALANGHAQRTGGDFCAATAALAAEASQAAEAGQADMIVALAERLAERPMGVGGDCQIAMRE